MRILTVMLHLASISDFDENGIKMCVRLEEKNVMKRQFKIPSGCGAISENVWGGCPPPHSKVRVDDKPFFFHFLTPHRDSLEPCYLLKE